MLSDFLEDFRRVTRTTRPDGLGGVTETWADGALFRGGITHAPGAEITVAGHAALRAKLALVHETSVGFQQDEFVRRVQDGAVFRIAGNSRDMQTPALAQAQFAQVAVERVALSS